MVMSPKKNQRKRSSLKKRRSVDEDENTITKVPKRAHFSSKNHVMEFKESEETLTIWGRAYETSVAKSEGSSDASSTSRLINTDFSVNSVSVYSMAMLSNIEKENLLQVPETSSRTSVENRDSTNSCDDITIPLNPNEKDRVKMYGIENLNITNMQIPLTKDLEQPKLVLSPRKMIFINKHSNHVVTIKDKVLTRPSELDENVSVSIEDDEKIMLKNPDLRKTMNNTIDMSINGTFKAPQSVFKQPELPKSFQFSNFEAKMSLESPPIKPMVIENEQEEVEELFDLLVSDTPQKKLCCLGTPSKSTPKRAFCLAEHISSKKKSIDLLNDIGLSTDSFDEKLKFRKTIFEDKDIEVDEGEKRKPIEIYCDDMEVTNQSIHTHEIAPSKSEQIIDSAKENKIENSRKTILANESIRVDSEDEKTFENLSSKNVKRETIFNHDISIEQLHNQAVPFAKHRPSIITHQNISIEPEETIDPICSDAMQMNQKNDRKTVFNSDMDFDAYEATDNTKKVNFTRDSRKTILKDESISIDTEEMKVTKHSNRETIFNHNISIEPPHNLPHAESFHGRKDSRKTIINNESIQLDENDVASEVYANAKANRMSVYNKDISIEPENPVSHEGANKCFFNLDEHDKSVTCGKSFKLVKLKDLLAVENKPETQMPNDTCNIMNFTNLDDTGLSNLESTAELQRKASRLLKHGTLNSLSAATTPAQSDIEESVKLSTGAIKKPPRVTIFEDNMEVTEHKSKRSIFRDTVHLSPANFPKSRQTLSIHQDMEVSGIEANPDISLKEETLQSSKINEMQIFTPPVGFDMPMNKACANSENALRTSVMMRNESSRVERKTTYEQSILEDIKLPARKTTYEHENMEHAELPSRKTTYEHEKMETAGLLARKTTYERVKMEEDRRQTFTIERMDDSKWMNITDAQFLEMLADESDPGLEMSASYAQKEKVAEKNATTYEDALDNFINITLDESLLNAARNERRVSRDQRRVSRALSVVPDYDAMYDDLLKNLKKKSQPLPKMKIDEVFEQLNVSPIRIKRNPETQPGHLAQWLNEQKELWEKEKIEKQRRSDELKEKQFPQIPSASFLLQNYLECMDEEIAREVENELIIEPIFPEPIDFEILLKNKFYNHEEMEENWDLDLIFWSWQCIKLTHSKMPMFTLNFKTQQTPEQIEESTIPIIFNNILLYTHPNFRYGVNEGNKYFLLKREFERMLDGVTNYTAMCGSWNEFYKFLDFYHDKVLKTNEYVDNFLGIIHKYGAIIKADPNYNMRIVHNRYFLRDGSVAALNICIPRCIDDITIDNISVSGFPASFELHGNKMKGLLLVEYVLYNIEQFLEKLR